MAKVPDPLSLENRGESWKQFKREWKFYEIASKNFKEDDEVRIAALMNVIGWEGMGLFDTFQWQANADEGKFEDVLHKFDENCLPRTNETYEAYTCFSRSQHAGETVEAVVFCFLFLTH